MIPFYRFNHLKSISKCRHCITTKVKEEAYDFSMALHTGEEKKSIIENRKKMVNQLGWEKNLSFIVANQTHGDTIHIIGDSRHRGWEEIEDAVEDCDALITNKKNIVLTMLTADCVPILLMDPKQNVIAAVHAGWRGTKAQVLGKTVKRICDVFGCEAHNIIVGIGPSIAKCCYEVDKTVADHFRETENVLPSSNDKYMLDLPMENKRQLLNVGVIESNIEMSDICTACEVERFFSYRKEKGCSGRFMSMIGLV